MSIFNPTFGVATLERAVKTAAQAAILVIGADQFNVFILDWVGLAGFAAGGFVLSVLTSVATAGIGGDGPSVAGETLDTYPRFDVSDLAL